MSFKKHIIHWVSYMLFNVGDHVSRNSYNNDTIFVITAINNSIANLKGVNIRLYADSPLDDLKPEQKKEDYFENDEEYVKETSEILNLDRNSFFYLPGKVLHFDGDRDYLDRCLKFYKKMNIQAYGVVLKEELVPLEISKYLNELKPDIVVITGHDYFYKNRDNKQDINNYRNTKYFIESVKNARKYENSHDKLIIIAGACQSNYEELIKAGANFASSPKRINIHALDPAIIASSIALSSRDSAIDIIKIISRKKYKEDGIGGIITNGMMYKGYPR